MHVKMRTMSLVSTLIVGLLLMVWLGLFSYSAVPVSAMDAIVGIWSPQPDVIAHVIVQDIRLPRVLEAALVGASLSCAGALMQGLTRNPLASPSVFGVNAGAALGIALATAVFSSNIISSPIAAMIGGFAAWVLVMVLGGAWKMGAERGQLVLAGIAISALCGALTKASVILVEEQAASVMVWLAGLFAHVSWDTWAWSWPSLFAALILSLLLAPKVNLLAMGDERVKSLGVNLNLLRAAIALAVLVLVGVSVSSVGAIAFVGLIVPHIGRLLVGYDYRILLPVSMLFGAVLTIGADILSRAVVFPTETPAGAVLAIIGAPCFLYLVGQKR